MCAWKRPPSSWNLGVPGERRVTFPIPSPCLGPADQDYTSPLSLTTDTASSKPSAPQLMTRARTPSRQTLGAKKASQHPQAGVAAGQRARAPGNIRAVAPLWPGLSYSHPKAGPRWIPLPPRGAGVALRVGGLVFLLPPPPGRQRVLAFTQLSTAWPEGPVSLGQTPRDPNPAGCHLGPPASPEA